MAWVVEFQKDFLAEFSQESFLVRRAIAIQAKYLEHEGPLLGRPYADTLKGSVYPNMKELRVTVPDGEWRVAFAFDPQRQAILLTAASKSGINSTDFYTRLIRVADQRYADHLSELKKKGK